MAQDARELGTFQQQNTSKDIRILRKFVKNQSYAGQGHSFSYKHEKKIMGSIGNAEEAV